MITRNIRLLFSACTLFQAAAVLCVAQLPVAGARWWSDTIEARLVEAGTNRPAITKALTDTPEARREGIVFLVENMPVTDLRSLTAAFLLENLDLGYEAWEKSPWHAGVPRELFLNDILPYACMNEARDPWRAQLRAACLPMVTRRSGRSTSV